MGAPPPPDPATADAAAFVASLSALRAWAGNPSLRSLRVLGGTTTTNGGDTVDALPVSTISYVLRGVRLPQLPRKSFVDAYVTACYRAAGREPADAPGRWVEAWSGLRGSSPAKATPLPDDTGDFTGRAGELARILGHVTHSTGATGIVTIGGAPGIGKTALALRAAHRLASRFTAVHYVDLRGRGRRPRTPLDALHSLMPDAGASLETAAARWRETTASAKTLVVLDDCRSAEQAAPLLPDGPGCFAILTSRARLAVDGAYAMTLGAFPAEQAWALLGRIAGEERLRGETEAVAELVARVGALPGAIRRLGETLRRRPAWTVREVLGALGRFDGVG
ncbi:NB-ARC domain-containing protein [Phytomonospora endophytica]|uniref:Orc1-like AAA ATPase domain-containing protein n=1 Tax=Phytomonospora endophytica TaxID=714109 RepID=A0A841FVM7_9ACTN|nr:NB-ARC domain-containing protein [Phytomonospora endophytica]MBB6036030.1 hypothetical protein [Phytomonospora endophytica]GIG66935.1 hypothetical protein Pen01_32300 [Phytomonospora endophytica]